MVLTLIRVLFVLLMAAVGWFYINQSSFWVPGSWMAIHIAIIIAVLFVCIDILAPRRKLTIFSGTFFGLIVGILVAYGLSFVVGMVVDNEWQPPEQMTPQDHTLFIAKRDNVEGYIDMLIGVTSCYLAISFILQTKDDFRFIIPYVEFSRQTKGPRPVLLDTSVLIDGRVADIAATGMLDVRMIVPRFVLLELQAIADSPDKLRRNRGRRGLDMLARLQSSNRTEVILYDSSAREEAEKEVDQRLMALATELGARVLTTDFNLNKVAQLRGVDVININDLANAVKPIVLPGEHMSVRILKNGEEPGQGVGYLEDGTMVVVEQGRQHMNEEIDFTVTSVLQTSAGKMIFGRFTAGGTADAASRARHKIDSASA
ncbi:MAG TPA: PIN domain-containing protein [Tepidisphaeraceae bacterium]|nr:PIN domain-containing protein [Tepidisphaeraceae bacterium]